MTQCLRHGGGSLHHVQRKPETHGAHQESERSGDTVEKQSPGRMRQRSLHNVQEAHTHTTIQASPALALKPAPNHGVR